MNTVISAKTFLIRILCATTWSGAINVVELLEKEPTKVFANVGMRMPKGLRLTCGRSPAPRLDRK